MRFLTKLIFMIMAFQFCFYFSAWGKTTVNLPDRKINDVLVKYFQIIHHCDENGKTAVNSAWCPTTLTPSKSINVPEGGKVYLGISARFFLKDMENALETAKKNEKDPPKNVKDVVDRVTSKPIIFINPALSLFYIKPQGISIRDVGPENKEERIIAECTISNVVSQLSGASNDSKIQTAPVLKEDLDKRTQFFSTYPFEQTKDGLISKDAKIPTLVRMVESPSIGAAYVVLEYDDTPNKENVFVNLFPIKEIASDKNWNKKCLDKK